jgi:DNA-binding beta-propeller fold protein YncE
VTGTITGVNVSYFGPGALAVNPAGTELFVVLGNYGVDVINLSTDHIAATVVLAGAEGIAAAPNGSAVYVTNGYLGVGEGAGTVSVLSTASNTITHTYSGMNEPIELAVSPSGGDVYVANVGAYITGTTGHSRLRPSR